MTKQTVSIRTHSSNLAVILSIYGNYINTTQNDSYSLILGLDTFIFILLIVGVGFYFFVINSNFNVLNEKNKSLVLYR